SGVFNRLVGEERRVVATASGTRRDSVDAVIGWPDLGRVRFVDTAGMRRGGKVRGVEYYSYLRAADAIDEADVVALVLDAVDGFTAEDRRLASRVLDAGRGLVLVANKWDLVENKDERFGRLRRLAEPFAKAEVVRTSALEGPGGHRLPPVRPMKDAPREAAAGRILTAANLITSLRIVLSPVFVGLIVDPGRSRAGLVLFGVVVATDWVDGWIARRTGQVSDVGKLLDPL